MNLLDIRRLEVISYRLFKILGLSGVFAFIIHNTILFQSFDSAEAIWLFAIIVQIVVQLRLPSNTDFLLKNELTDSRRFVSVELRFLMVLTVFLFFVNLGMENYALRIILAANFIVQLVIFAIARLYASFSLKSRQYRPSQASDKTAIIIGTGKKGKETADLILDHPELNLRIIGFIDLHKKGFWRYRDIPLIGHPDDMIKIIACNQLDCALLALEKEDLIAGQRIFETLERMGVNICILPNIFERKISQCNKSSLNGHPVLIFHPNEKNPAAMLIKDIFDRSTAVAGIILSIPIFIIAAIAIKLDSSGPIIYHQLRCGKNGRLFPMLKLRTMRFNSENLKSGLIHFNKMTGPVFKMSCDPRVTTVGKFLRKYSIDELPQLINVVCGDMSLVGPRPPLPEEVEQYKSWQRRRLSVRPGLTCLWQVNGRNDVDFEEWMRLDLEYIDNWSLAKDAGILAKTIPTVLKGNGV
jgi:exopolysaccharide biosynthesis polyprenyl glycosylphosphotransferase